MRWIPVPVPTLELTARNVQALRDKLETYRRVVDDALRRAKLNRPIKSSTWPSCQRSPRW